MLAVFAFSMWKTLPNEVNGDDATLSVYKALCMHGSQVDGDLAVVSHTPQC